MLPKKLDLSGERFGKLTAICEASERSKCRNVRWICKCDCGNIVTLSTGDLRSGHTKSCGCIRMPVKQEWHRLYRIHKGMRDRCYLKTHEAYASYGGRGITVCDEWLGKGGFYRFKDWALAHGYDDSLTLDRIDANAGYNPDNCRFATYKEQANNKRNNVYLTIDGVTKTFAQWCELYNIAYSTARYRMKTLGWTAKEALTIPLLRKRKERLYG